MREDYLWDRSGPPDPEIEALERTLAPLRHRHRARPSRAVLAVAASVLAAVAVWRFEAPPAQVTAWQVAGDGTPVRVGQVLRTVAHRRLVLRADAVGEIDLGPESQLRAAADHRLELDRGSLHAFIWAPPRQFVLDTPSARAIDLGCEYTIEMQPSGDGLLRVRLGWVAFQFEGRESFIPAGAQCVTRKRAGIGIPFFDDAPEPLREAIARFDGGDGNALAAIMANARPRDGLTLWHLLTRVREQERGAVYDRLAQLVTLPPEATRGAVLRKDPAAIDACWNALNLENVEWWRGWERRL